MATNLFNPVMGPEKVVLATDPSSGSVYFTTDTRKIYLDVDEDRVKLPMGGNIGLFYGKMKPASPPVDGQTEFRFKITDIVGNEKAKGKTANLWRYRALSGGFNIFEHEYIMIFQKTKLKKVKNDK
jgi:hypothetical protein